MSGEIDDYPEFWVDLEGPPHDDQDDVTKIAAALRQRTAVRDVGCLSSGDRLQVNGVIVARNFSHAAHEAQRILGYIVRRFVPYWQPREMRIVEFTSETAGVLWPFDLPGEWSDELGALGLTYDELADQAAQDEFSSEAAARLWFMISPTPKAGS